MERQGARPHRADPGNLRPQSAHQGGRAPGRAGASDLSAQPAGEKLDTLGTPARRLRLSRRAGRKPARNRSPPDRRADCAHRDGARQGQEAAQASPRQPRASAVPDRRAGRLHQRRQIHAVQPHDQRERAAGRHAVCHARPDTAGGAIAGRHEDHPVRHRGLHFRPADHAGGGVPRHARRGDRGRRDPACARRLARGRRGAIA